MASVPGMIALVGVLALAYAQANDHIFQQDQINNGLTRLGQTESDQTSICNSVFFIPILKSLFPHFT